MDSGTVTKQDETLSSSREKINTRQGSCAAVEILKLTKDFPYLRFSRPARLGNFSCSKGLRYGRERPRFKEAASRWWSAGA